MVRIHIDGAQLLAKNMLLECWHHRTGLPWTSIERYHWSSYQCEALGTWLFPPCWVGTALLVIYCHYYVGTYIHTCSLCMYVPTVLRRKKETGGLLAAPPGSHRLARYPTSGSGPFPSGIY